MPVHGAGTNGRINSAYGGGPQRLVATVTEALGIPIDYYLEMDFNGFRGLVDGAGGVDMQVPLPARDPVSGLNIPEVTFDGNTALSWVRSRAYEEQLEDGTWRRDPRADHGRIERQQVFIRQLMHGLAAKAGGFNVFAMNRMLQTAVDDVRIDSELHSRLIAVARRVRSVEPETIEMATLPTVGARVSGQAVLKLDEPDARPVLDHFAT